MTSHHYSSGTFVSSFTEEGASTIIVFGSPGDPMRSGGCRGLSSSFSREHFVTTGAIDLKLYIVCPDVMTEKFSFRAGPSGAAIAT
jgi:uncharacterized protein (DUF2237 family)